MAAETPKQLEEDSTRERKDGHFFGYGTFFLPPNTDLELLSEADKKLLAKKLGWSNGCPIVEELIGPDSPYGLDWMVQRYSETNSWFNSVLTRTLSLKTALYRQLAYPAPRLWGEPAKKYEPQSVPKNHLTQISPMSGLVGYALPRVLLEYFKEGGSVNYDRVLDLSSDLESLIRRADTPEELLARLSETLLLRKIPALNLLQHNYPQGILAEQNTRRAFQGFAIVMDNVAPTLFREFTRLTEKDKKDWGIASIPTS